MIGTSRPEYLWVRGWAIILHSIAPLCIAYSFAALFLPRSLRLPIYLESWLFAEVVFYLLFSIHQVYYLQRPALHPPLPPAEERQKLFRLCQDSTEDAARYISGWFFHHPIITVKRENIKEFFRWAFLNTDTHDPTYDDEIEGYVTTLEKSTGLNFEYGRADSDMVFLDMLTHVYMRFHSFQFYRSSLKQWFTVFPLRPQSLVTTHVSDARNLTYWYRRHTAKNELPILFLHGIGVGLYPYMEFLQELNGGRRAEDGVIGILAVEILPISSRITSPLLRKEEMCQQLRVILQQHHYEKCILVSHSYGSVVATHILKTPDLASMVSSVVLVDPISIMLHQPDVAYNFIARRPKGANEWLVWYFGSMDVGVAHTLSRTFFWSENILWKEDLIGHRTTVFLSSKDCIVNAPVVRAYLESSNQRQQEKQQLTEKKHVLSQSVATTQLPETFSSKDGMLNVMWCENLDHGQIFDLAPWRNQLRREVLLRANQPSKPI